MNKLRSYLIKSIPLLAGLFLWLMPVPSGLDPKAWQLLAIFIGTILGLILKPIPAGAVAFLAITLTAFTGVYIQELSFSINNNLRPIHAIGSNTIQEIAVGKQDITGTLAAYFKSDRLFDQFLAGSATALDFTITDGTNSYTVLFPNVKFESESIVAPGQDQDVIENITWRALYDSSENSQVKITRVTG